MLIAALFTIVKIWKQPKCPSVDEWVKKKLWYIYMMEYYSAIKKEKKRNVTEGGLILTSSDPLGKLHGKPSYRRQFAW